MVSFAQARALDPNYNADESVYAWIITTDHLAETEAERKVRIVGPHNATAEQLARLDAGEGVAFKLYDDDDELYFTGRFLGDSESEDGFGPLNDYGEPDSGCTSIRYRRGHGWETL